MEFLEDLEVRIDKVIDTFNFKKVVQSKITTKEITDLKILAKQLLENAVSYGYASQDCLVATYFCNRLSLYAVIEYQDEGYEF